MHLRLLLQSVCMTVKSLTKTKNTSFHAWLGFLDFMPPHTLKQFPFSPQAIFHWHIPPSCRVTWRYGRAAPVVFTGFPTLPLLEAEALVWGR